MSFISSGQEEIRFPNGTVQISFADGSVKKIFVDGSEEIKFPDGTQVQVAPNGDRTLLMPNGQKEFHSSNMKVPRIFFFLLIPHWCFGKIHHFRWRKVPSLTMPPVW